MRKEGAERQSAKAIAAGIPECGDRGHPVDFMAAITETVACLFKGYDMSNMVDTSKYGELRGQLVGTVTLW